MYLQELGLKRGSQNLKANLYFSCQCSGRLPAVGIISTASWGSGERLFSSFKCFVEKDKITKHVKVCVFN